MRITAVDDVAKLVALTCGPDRVAAVRTLIAEAGIILRGHFQLQSGGHSGHFLRARALATQKDLLDAFAHELLSLIPEHDSQVVLCPESAGFALGDAVARLAELPLVVVKTDIHRRPSGEVRAGQLPAGARTLLVNDVMTSGASLRLLHQAALSHGAVVERVVTLATTGSGALHAVNELNIKGSWLIEGTWPLFPADTCELCKQGVPLMLSSELG